jgi:hypothetical protein
VNAVFSVSGDIFIGIVNVPDRELHTIMRLLGEIVYKTILIFQILNNRVRGVKKGDLKRYTQIFSIRAPIDSSGGSSGTNSAKNSTNVLGYLRKKAGLAIGGVFGAENHR